MAWLITVLWTKVKGDGEVGEMSGCEANDDG